MDNHDNSYMKVLLFIQNYNSLVSWGSGIPVSQNTVNPKCCKVSKISHKNHLCSTYKVSKPAKDQSQIHPWCWDSKNTSVTVITRWTVPAWLLVCLFPDTWFIATIFNFMCSIYMIFVMIFWNIATWWCSAALLVVAAWFAQCLLSDAALQNNNYRSEQIFYPTVGAKSVFF